MTGQWSASSYKKFRRFKLSQIFEKLSCSKFSYRARHSRASSLSSSFICFSRRGYSISSNGTIRHKYAYALWRGQRKSVSSASAPKCSFILEIVLCSCIRPLNSVLASHRGLETNFTKAVLYRLLAVVPLGQYAQALGQTQVHRDPTQTVDSYYAPLHLLGLPDK